MQNIEDLRRLKDTGLLITPAKENNGLSVPSGYKVMRCNLDAVVAAEWDPIGEWEPTANNVLQLTSNECRLTLYENNGMLLEVPFQKGDYRYQIDNWLVTFTKNKMKVSRIFEK
jgi:hypothetical protein